jgi:energy-coupling factor transport system ATP-binding protein
MSLEVMRVSYTYSPGTPYARQALRDISVTFSHGEFTGIIGHTGSGKSTLIQQLNGLIVPTSGMVRIEGIDIHMKTPEAKTARRKVGMVFQYPEHQLFDETVYADIAFGPRNAGIHDAQLEERVQKAMHFVGLDYREYKDRSPFSLSGGQMRRVAIAGVIALQPDYLILDEPTAGLDPQGRDEILEQIYRLYTETGITVILVSHNMEEVVRFAKRILVMHNGGILLDGSPQRIFEADPELLEQAGIQAPQITQLMQALVKAGKPVQANIMTIDEAIAEILPWAGRVKR